MKQRMRMIGLALVVGMTVPSVAAGQDAREPRALELTAENLMAGDERHQALAERGGDPQTLLAGDVVRYRLRFTNLTEVSVRSVVFENPVPGGLRFVGSSAAADREDIAIEYSIDGGRSYAPQPMIVEIVDGRRVERPAPPELYTHVRWTVRGWVEPGAQVTAEFRARLESGAKSPQGH